MQFNIVFTIQSALSQSQTGVDTLGAFVFVGRKGRGDGRMSAVPLCAWLGLEIILQAISICVGERTAMGGKTSYGREVIATTRVVNSPSSSTISKNVPWVTPSRKCPFFIVIEVRIE